MMFIGGISPKCETEHIFLIIGGNMKKIDSSLHEAVEVGDYRKVNELIKALMLIVSIQMDTHR